MSAAGSTVTPAPRVDWLTVVAIVAMAISFNVAFHEGVHALTCAAVGGQVREYSALYVDCGATAAQNRWVAGSASIANLAAGFLLWAALRRSANSSARLRFFLWLFMLMNWLYGAGYWMFSGIANIGDWAEVTAGWQPAWLWRVLLTVMGTALFMFFVWLALRELGRIIGGEGSEQIKRATKLGLIAYATSAGVIVLAGLFNPFGFLSLPVTAGLAAVLGALSPLLWMMQWFRSPAFRKTAREPLEITRNWVVIAGAAVVVLVYAVILGRTLYF
jgi:hypothetical protein